MEKTSSQHVALKVLVALLPTLIFVQDYAWMTANSMIGIAFVVLLLVVIWAAWSFKDKNAILERYFRLTEVGFFLMPISALILTFALGSQVIGSSADGAAQAGAAIGTAIGGMFVIVLSFVIGIPAGIIMHLVAGNYAKKVGADHAKQPETLAAKHGVILSIAALIALAIVLGSVSGAQHSAQVAKEKAELSSSLQQGSAGQNNAANEDNAKAETQSVTLEVVKKDFHAADYMSGSYQDQITMSLKFTNNTEKEVRGVEGVITFYDIFDNKISATRVSYDKGILANDSKVWESATDYNQFVDADVKLRNTALADLKYNWEISTILYADGSKETF